MKRFGRRLTFTIYWWEPLLVVLAGFSLAVATIHYLI